MTIENMDLGQEAVVVSVGGEGIIRTHFLGMGLIPGARLKLIKRAPLGDPLEIQIHGYALTLRKAEAADIEVRLSGKHVPEETLKSPAAEEKGYNAYLHEHNAHPGLGEGGKYHSKDHEHPLPKDTVLSFALAGSRTAARRPCSMS